MMEIVKKILAGIGYLAYGLFLLGLTVAGLALWNGVILT